MRESNYLNELRKVATPLPLQYSRLLYFVYTTRKPFPEIRRVDLKII